MRVPTDGGAGILRAERSDATDMTATTDAQQWNTDVYGKCRLITGQRQTDMYIHYTAQYSIMYRQRLTDSGVQM